MGYLSEGPMLCTKKHNQACAERDEETVPSKKAGYVLEEPMVYTKKHRRTHADTTSKKTTSSPTRKNDQTPVEIPAFKRCRRPSRPEDRDRHLLPFQSWTLNLRRHEYNRNHPLFETPSPTEPELLFCSFCGVMHPSALFSEEEREKAHGERMCHDVTGSIRVCSHLSVPMVDVWKWFDTGLALRQAGKEDRIEPLVRACERCRGLLNLDEFGAAVRFARPPSMTVHPHDTEWFDVFSEVEVSWTLPVFNSAQRDVADNTTSEDFLKWNLEELERRLIYVHDIGGSPKTTWHHDDSGKTWISDPEFLGNFSNSARVWTYGFNSEPAVNMTPSSIALHANELLSMMVTGYTINGGGGPTIFIAHGLGGIIVKKAILLALSCPEYFSISNTTFGIVFLDTVHHGSDSEGVLTAVKTIAALALQKGSLKPSWEDTRQYSDAVREVNVAFIDRLPSGLEILNFVATRRVELPVEGAEPHKALGIGGYVKETVSSAASAWTKEGPGSHAATAGPRPGPPVGRPPMMAPPMRDLGGGSYQIWLRKKSTDYLKERRDRLVSQLGDWSDVHFGHDINPMPETCKWIETHPYFVQWSKSNATEDFFVYGPAGCGKTHLAKSVVNHLSWDGSRPVENIVLPFFCNVSVTGNKRPPIMEHFVKAMFRLRPVWFELLGAQSQHPDDEGRPSLAFLFDIIRQLMTKLQLNFGSTKTTNVFLIIDGINECEAAFVREFLQLVASLVEHPGARATPPVPPLTTVPPLPPNQLYPRETVRFKFFFTYTPNEVMSLASVRATRIKMKDEDIRKSISTYVDKTMEDLCTVKSTKDPREEVGPWIKENAGSFFLFAHCAMEDGIATAKEHEYGYSMSRRAFPCPRKLAEYYDHDLLPLFQSVDNGNYALSALQVILGTFTPVSGLMIRDALSCLHHDPRLKFIDIQTILTHRCARLVKVSDAYEVSPIHPSLGIHFASYISKEEQHANMASLCIKYLSQPVFEGGFGAVERAREHLFYKYAANSWRGHLRFSKDKRMKLLPQLRRFFNSKSYWVWCRYMQNFFDSPKSVISLVIALIPANAADIVHLVDQSIIMDDPETYPWQTGVWGFFWRLKQNAWRRFPEVAQFADSFRERHYHMAWDPHGLTPLMHAAKDPRGLPDMVNHFLQWPELINRRDPAIGATAMMFFSRYTESTDGEFIADMIDGFVNAGADVDMSTFLGETCLWLACKSGNLVLVNELLRVKANPNIATVDGSTPIHQALTRWTPKSHKIIQDLVLHGADLNIKFPSPELHIPLTSAIVGMRFETFLFLLRFLDDVNQIDDGGYAAIHLLVQPKYLDWLPHLLERPDLDLELLTDSKSKNGASIRQTALSFAIVGNSFKAAEMLLRAGARPYRHPNATDRTPLYIDADFAKMGGDDSSENNENRSSNLDIAKLLLSYNSPINILDPKKKFYSRSPLTRAVDKGNYAMVELLLSHGADPTLEEAYGLPGPLGAAVAKGNIGIIKLLLENSLPPNINYIATGFDHILNEAAAQSPELVTLLLDRGADTKRFLSPGDARTPLQSAVMENNVPLCKLFIEREPELVNYQNQKGLVCETPLVIAAREGNLEIVNCLLDAGADPDLRSFHYNETPLWSACLEGKLEIAKLLYEKAPETINTPSYDGETPLMKACESGSLQLVTFLLEKGADFRPRCSSCASCVAKALTRDSGAPPFKIIEALIQHGLGVDDVVSSVGYTVLGEACRIGDVPTVRLLLDMGADPVKGQKAPGKTAFESCWRSALQVAVYHEEVKVLDVLLEHLRLADFIGHVDFYGETVLHTNIPSDSASRMATKILGACDKLRPKDGPDVFRTMMEVESLKELTPLDLALGGLHKELSAQGRAKVDEVILRCVLELLASEITLDEHFHVIRDLSRLLLIRGGYDEEAVRLTQSFIVDAWVREKDGEFEETVFCEYFCDECGKEEDEKLYFCRFCVWNTGRCCFKDYRGVHRLIEVPVVMERKILNLRSAEFIEVLGFLQEGFTIHETDAVEGDLGEVIEVEADSDETTLSLAFLHALGYLEFRRRAWSPYLSLAPRVYKRIDAWDFLMARERKGFQEWVWQTELQPWRLKSELRYFLESGRRTAYKDVETTMAEEILRDLSARNGGTDPTPAGSSPVSEAAAQPPRPAPEVAEAAEVEVEVNHDDIESSFSDETSKTSTPLASFHHVQPGLVEFQESSNTLYLKRSSLKPENAMIKMIDRLVEAWEKIGLTMGPVSSMKRWPKDERLKRMGSLMGVNHLDGLGAFAAALFKVVLGWPKIEVTVLNAGMSATVRKRGAHPIFDFVIVTGQKPK
ncbi:hypothetical protein CkaCkLH20_11173 [Colletotrichum karsti]|uniref:Nephrocystin 3-like N-terminal domain-containing protein n=1 Tax=Colletotrichum karsti TaxID=1095194 RepID=A0A9P6HWF6_9PEZI|nr:uncharacterized protein CkaCkLH20_11173 [Colletotrichum karsti]KAF9871252.1 hypothetical protein CkaCkLH20_11173 [Colletotrichum karsti]